MSPRCAAGSPRDPAGASSMQRSDDEEESRAVRSDSARARRHRDSIRRHAGHGGGACQNAPPPMSPEDCAALVGTTISASTIDLPTTGATVKTATWAVETGGGQCRVVGDIHPVDPTAPAIEFQVNLPENWNERALQFGGGGYDGSLVTGLGQLSAAAGRSADAAPAGVRDARFGRRPQGCRVRRLVRAQRRSAAQLRSAVDQEDARRGDGAHRARVRHDPVYFYFAGFSKMAMRVWMPRPLRERLRRRRRGHAHLQRHDDARGNRLDVPRRAVPRRRSRLDQPDRARTDREQRVRGVRPDRRRSRTESSPTPRDAWTPSTSSPCAAPTAPTPATPACRTRRSRR